MPREGDDAQVRTYQTLAQLRDAYASGKVIAPLIVGHNTDCEVIIPGVSDDPEYIDGSVFEMDICQLLGEALDLLGIPHEHD